MIWYQLLIIMIVCFAMVSASLWLGICIGSKYVERVEDSEFWLPMKSKEYTPMASFTDEPE